MTKPAQPPLRWTDLDAQVAEVGLWAMGGFHPGPDDDVPAGTQTVVLLAPRDPGFWDLVTAALEFADGAPDPLDRWSRRVVGHLACGLGAKALFPFSGPPWRPFLTWAVRTGQLHQSPVGLLVNERTGLWASLRGALALRERIEVPAATAHPCESCADKPCLTACPIGALDGTGYDTDACRSYLATPGGAASMAAGCGVRLACPISAGYSRDPRQSAFHMRAFTGTR